MQPTPEAASRGPPKPYIIDGQRFYNVWQAAQIVKGVSDATLWNWAKKGVTSFGFELDVQREPVIHEPRGYRKDAKTHRESRMLISEEKVLALKEILQDAGRIRPGPFTDCERDALRAAAYRHRTPRLASQHS
jgi:hypothetical protein